MSIRDDCFAYWKIEQGNGRFLLPCKGKACKGRLMITTMEPWEADHQITKAHGGSDKPPNVRPLCIDCHKEKTGKVDLPAIAKGKRQARRVFGVKQSRGWYSRFKRKLSGEVVER